jgi:PAS domain S-box-containing protein
MNKGLKRKLSWFMTANKCPYSGLAITHPESFASSDSGSNFYVDIARLSRNILLVKAHGYVSSFAESEMQAFIDSFISRHIGAENRFIYLEDYSNLTGGDAESRKKYIAYFNSKDLLITAIIYHLPPIYKISFNLMKKLHLYAARAHAVSTYEQAINLALKQINTDHLSPGKNQNITVLAENTANRHAVTNVLSRLSEFFSGIYEKSKKTNIFFTQKAKQRLAQEYSEALIQYIATIDWRTPGLHTPINLVGGDASSKKIFDAIGFIKSEVDTLMEERDTAEAVLRESETRYRLLVEHAKAGFMEYDYITNQITSVNDELIHMTGYSEAELLGKAPLKLLTEESRKIFLKRLSQIQSGEPISQDIVYQGVTKSNEVRWWLLNSNVTYHQNAPEKAYAVLTDITILKQTEKQLLEYQEKLKRLSIRLSMIEEDQRRSMASHLHETIGQELFVMQLQLNTFEKSLDNPELLSSLTQINKQLLKIIRETKNLTFELSPPVLYDFGFEEALKALSETIKSKHSVHVQTFFEGEMDSFDDEIKIIVYRNIKELLHNCVKHSNAENITMHLIHSQFGLNIELHDDGIGFDAADFINETDTHDGFGLFDIREKLNHLGGQLIIDSAPGLGTSISMQIPLHVFN